MSDAELPMASDAAQEVWADTTQQAAGADVKESPFREQAQAVGADTCRQASELHDDAFEELKCGIADLRTDMTSQRADLRRHSTKLKRLAAATAELKAEQELRRNELESIREDVAMLEGDVAILQRNVTLLKGDMRDLKGGIAVMQQDVEEMNARQLLGALRHCIKLMGHHYGATVNERESDDMPLGRAIWIHVLYEQSTNPRSPDHQDVKKKFATFTAEEPFTCFRDAAVIAVAKAVSCSCGDGYSSHFLLSSLDEDPAECRRLLKSQLSGHTQEAIDKLIDVVLELRHTVMAVALDW